MDKYNNPEWIGKKFGSLTVIRFLKGYKARPTAWFWIMKCDCGNETIVNPYKAIHGNITSCGCMKKERCRMMTEKYRIKHGDRGERLYTIWRGMKLRCFNKNNKDYVRYGGRGITVCKEWENDYVAFKTWALANGYSDNLSIDRIDVNGNYEPDNCRWSNTHIQNTNQRISHNFSYRGEIKNITDIAKEENISYQTLYKWAVREKLPIEEAVAHCKKRNPVALTP